MIEQIGLLGLDIGQERFERCRLVDPDSDRKRVDEETDHRLDAVEARRATRDGRTEHDVVLPRHMRQKNRPGNLDNGIGGDADSAGEFGDPTGRRGREVDRDLP